jgi:hypothetical protein
MIIYPTIDRTRSETLSCKILILLLCSLVALLAGCDSDRANESSYSIKKEKWYQARSLIAEAWQLPVALSYSKNFEYQENGAFCGPASIVNLFHSIGVNEVSQSSLFDNSSVYYLKARFLGLTLDEMWTLINDNLNESGFSEWSVRKFRNLTINEFRDHMRLANNSSRRYIINFHRQPLFGINVGHHSPVGGYIESSDMVFVLDVLEDYKPFLVPVEKLYTAMNTIDSEIDRKRGLILVQRETRKLSQNLPVNVK